MVNVFSIRTKYKIMKKFLLLLLSAASFDIHATTLYNWQITRIIDGDTVVVSAPWLPDPLKKELAIRVYGVDTPEKGFRAKCTKEGELGKSASKFTQKILSNGKNIQIELRDWDKYGGRVLGNVIIDGKSLRDLLITNGFAREYYGEAKQSWCN
jgi:endonuclease YncB( thermonuclease family)